LQRFCLRGAKAQHHDGYGRDAVQRKIKEAIDKLSRFLKAPQTSFGPDMMIPLMLLGNTDNNQELMFFMMTQMNNKACDAPAYYGVHHE